MTITIDIEEFTASPIISQSNNIEISFKDFHLSIKPKKNISNLLMVFRFNKGSIELYEETDAIEYTFSSSISNNRCYINLQSQSMANCIANAGLKISAIKIYKR
jgi:sucrose-6-phosphate hydrolase SacC (GH32 family)